MGHHTQEELKIPFWINLRIFTSLTFSLVLFIGIYVAIYFGAAYFEGVEITQEISTWGVFIVCLAILPLLISLLSKDKLQGFELKKKDFPDLHSTVKEVATDLGLEMPKKIFLYGDSSIFVSGFRKKYLGIGLAGLRSITKEQFKGILYHEFGHIYGHDTMFGLVLAKIHRSFVMTSDFGKAFYDAMPIMQLAIIGGFIRFLGGIFGGLFKGATLLYSRQVEFRADYIAAQMVGERTYSEGLVNYTTYTDYFENVGFEYVQMLLNEDRAFVNMYEAIYHLYADESKDRKEGMKKHTLRRKWINLTTHPSTRKRIKAAGVNYKSIDLVIHKQSAQKLVKEHYEKEFTKAMTGNVEHNNLMQELYDDAVAREGKCRFCGEQFEKLQEFAEHEATCTARRSESETELEMDCPECGKDVTVSLTLEEEEEYESGNDMIVPCPHCKYEILINIGSPE